MKKVLKVLSVGLLSAIVATAATSAVFAAGINDAEQKILDELNTTVVMNGKEKALPADYVNQAENYFNTVDITDDQANQVISGIEEAKSYLESTGVANAKDLSSSQVDTLVSKCQSAVSVVGLTLSYTKSSGAVTISDKDGKAVFSGTTVSFTNGGTTNGGSTNNGTTNGGSSNGVIKTTGADFNIPGVVAVAGVGVLFVSAAGVYLFKSSKKENTVGVNA